jgi:hypothetical protein
MVFASYPRTTRSKFDDFPSLKEEILPPRKDAKRLSAVFRAGVAVPVGFAKQNIDLRRRWTSRFYSDCVRFFVEMLFWRTS